MECMIRDLSLNYEILGQGRPVVMIHGYSPDHRLMAGCMEPVFLNNSNYKRIYLDLPGMGKTKAKEWVSNSDIMLDIIIEFIDTIIPDTKFLLAGESYGGYLARGIVYKMPDRVDGLLLLCPCIAANSKERTLPPHTVLEKDPLLAQAGSEALEDLEDFKSMAVVQSQKTWTRYQNEILPGLKIADNQFLTYFQETGYEFSFSVDSADRSFNKPALLVLGRQDSVVGYKDAWKILDNYPRATFAVLDKAGHNLQIEQEEVFNSLVSNWLLRIKEDMGK